MLSHLAANGAARIAVAGDSPAADRFLAAA
jgi:hypothetical protein